MAKLRSPVHSILFLEPRKTHQHIKGSEKSYQKKNLPSFFLRVYTTFFFFLLYNIVLVLPYINMNPPRVYTCSQSWTPLPSPSAYHPSGSSQCTSPNHPVSCIKPGLAIRFLYDIIHVSMPFSQIIPPLPLPQSPKDCSMFIAALFITARTWKQPICPLADEWIRKLWYIYTMKYYSAIKKNTFESVLKRWMKLEPIIQSEVSQKEKHQYSILTHIYHCNI